MCDLADGTNDVEAKTIRKARRSHVCRGCHETIRPGTRYVITSVLFDGSWSTWKHCMRCDAMYTHLTERAWKADDDIVIAPSLDCGEKYEHAWGEAPPESIAALAFALPEDFATKESTP